MNNIIIRPAQPKDYEPIEHIMQQVHMLHVGWRPDVYQPRNPVLPREVFEEALTEENFLVAEFDCKVVGLLFYTLRHKGEKSTLFVDSMAVEETYRGKGIGHALFDYAKNLAHTRNYSAIELQVNGKNARAREMYEKYGFTERSINMELKF